MKSVKTIGIAFGVGAICFTVRVRQVPPGRPGNAGVVAQRRGGQNGACRRFKGQGRHPGFLGTVRKHLGFPDKDAFESDIKPLLNR
jgi:hypothetical protein